MCSCLTSFPGFFRYHLPLLRSIVSFLSSGFQSLHLSRSLNRSSHSSKTPGSKSSSTKGRATKDIKVTLGSRVDGRGRFMTPASVLATNTNWLPLSEVPRDSPSLADNVQEATHRQYYEEVAEDQQSRVRHPPSAHEEHSQEIFGPHNGERAPKPKPHSASGSAWWKQHRQSNTTRTGYWDLLSFLRSDTAMSSGQSKMHSESDSSVV